MLLVLSTVLFTLAQRMSASDKRLIVLFLCLLLSFSALVLNKPDHYAIVLAPIMWLVTGAALDVLSGRIQQRETRAPSVYFGGSAGQFPGGSNYDNAVFNGTGPNGGLRYHPKRR